MPDSLRDLVVSLSLNTDNFTRNIRSVNKQIQEAESYFKKASAGVEGFESSTAGLSAKLNTLERQLSLQKEVVTQYQNALTAANAKLTEAYNRYQTYNQRLEEAKRNYAEMQQYLQEQKDALQQVGDALGTDSDYYKDLAADIDQYEQQVNAAGEELKKLSGQTEALRKSTQNAADAVSTAQTQLNKAEAAVARTGAEIKKTSDALRTAESAWTSLGKSCAEAGKRLEASGRAASTIGRTLTRGVTTPIMALGATSLKASMDFESSFASVRKTVDATEEEFARLAAQSKEMSTQVAASTSEINEVMATGGQLGVANENLRDFTKVMIDLGNSCEDLSADEAATSIAKFANVMHTDQKYFENIGSTIVDLGNNFATTEQPIMMMAQRLAGAGRQVGLTEAQVLGFATALSSVGIEAQMGGSAFSKALIKMEVAAATGGDALKDFARVSGMTAEGFKELFETDPAAAFQSFIVGLSKLDEEGESAIAVLDEIGIKEVRLRDTMLRSVNATELFANAQARATKAWEENTALSVEANKRYATTASKLTNLKNRAMLLGQTIGDDLNPKVQSFISWATDLLANIENLDSAERQQMIKMAAVVASIGPLILAYGKLSTGLGKAVTTFGTFATAVGKAGGGLTGFMTILAKSPAVWLAVAAAVVYGVYKLYDWASGAKQAREATQDLIDTANDWKATAADTFYGKENGGLGFFGLSEDSFRKDRTAASAKEWMAGLTDVWKDGEKETDEIVQNWTDSWKSLTDSTRTELHELQEVAKTSGNSQVTEQIQKDIDSLDSMDQEIESLLKKRKNGYLSDSDQLRLQELIDTREAIIVKYKLEPDSNTAGYDTILDGIEKAQARARALGNQDADVEVYQQAVVAAAQGYAVINEELDTQYDKEYAVVQLIEDEAERKAAQAKLDEQYNADRLAAAQEYARTLAQVIGPAWESEEIQNTKTSLDSLSSALTAYDVAVKSNGKDSREASDALAAVNRAAQQLDESDLTEYAAMLTQVSELLDSGMSEEEVSKLFPEIDLSSALEQLAAIQEFVNTYDSLGGIASMFGEGLANEVMEIATKLNMEGAQADWDKFAADPGQITTDAKIKEINAQESVKEILLTGRIDKVLKESGVTLTVDTEGNVTNVKWDENTKFTTDVFGNITEATAADGTVFKVDANGQIISAVAADGTTFTVDGGTGTITDVVLGESVTMPEIKAKLSVSGYDMFAINNFVEKNPVQIKGVVRLGSLYENPEEVLGVDGAKFFGLSGEQIPVEIVPKEKLTADTIIAYDADGTIHVLLTPEIGSTELVDATTKKMEDKGPLEGTFLDPLLTNTSQSIQNIRAFANEISNLGDQMEKVKENGGITGQGMTLPEMQQEQGFQIQALVTELEGLTDLDIENMASQAAALMAALDSGNLDAETAASYAEQLQGILDVVNAADEFLGAGNDVSEGIAQGMTSYGWSGDASTLAASLTDAIRGALGAQSPATTLIPTGTDVAAGVAQGMTSYSFGSAAGSVASNVRSVMSTSMDAASFRPIGSNAMSGLAAGIAAGRSGVISAMREAARAAVNAAKAELLIKSPSRVFRDEVGSMVMKGFGEGVLEETAQQAKVIRNAARYLTDEAADGAIGRIDNRSQRTYNNNASVNFSGSTFVIREEQDIYNLANELAALKAGQMRALGSRG